MSHRLPATFALIASLTLASGTLHAGRGTAAGRSTARPAATATPAPRVKPPAMRTKLGATRGRAIASATAPRTGEALPVRWARLAATINPDRWWAPRITLSGRITHAVRMSGTTDAEIYHQGAIDHPITQRFLYAETWRGSLMDVDEINLLVKDRSSGEIVAEVTWHDQEGVEGVELVTPAGTRRFDSQENALTAFFAEIPGFRAAQRAATASSAHVSYAYEAMRYQGGGYRTATSGLVRPSLADPARLVFQDARGWGGKRAEVAMKRIDPRTLADGARIRLARGEVLAIEGDATLPTDWDGRSLHPRVSALGKSAAPTSKAYPAMTLFRVDEIYDVRRFEVEVGRGNASRIIKVEVTGGTPAAR